MKTAKPTSVGAFEAKTHLNELLVRVSKGEEIQITRRGVPVAKLVPPDTVRREDLLQAARDIREIRKGVTLGKITLKELINEGRRF